LDLSESVFTARDLDQIKQLGIRRDEVLRQIEQLRNPPPFADLARPCRQGDGIRILPLEAHRDLIERCDQAATQGRITKFVPASGAATRMFRSQLAVLAEIPPPDRDALTARAEAGEVAATEALTFIDHIDDFTFSAQLRSKLSALGVTSQRLETAAEIGAALLVLTKEAISLETSLSGANDQNDLNGFGYAALPKAMIPFHRQGPRNQTALDEHFAEAASYGRDGKGRCRLHLTISEMYRDRFVKLIAEAKQTLQGEQGVSCEVALSVQSPATDTIALASDHTPFRLDDGSILFRPGGHGALIYNLTQMNADIVLIKNIDNVIPRYLRDDTILWKKLLTGCLLELQERSFDLLKRLNESTPNDSLVAEVSEFVRNELGTPLPAEFDQVSLSEQTTMVTMALDRPLRVCGVVMNEGEPGGGPYWVRDDRGETKQIVEASQIDQQNREQAALMASATHFNPVDLACGLRNWRGEPFLLLDFVDPNTSFVSEKSEAGRDLKALERPGLWNGAMAAWHTVFIEVPLSTFTPVKTILDLLRPVHQPEANTR
jgi:Domain of unknown function (DUF4301)